MRILLLQIILLVQISIQKKNTVYFCDSNYAKKYHLRNDCKGLSHCTHKIIELTLEEAKKRKLELCKFEQ